MITLDDYNALLGRILDPNQQNYTYLSYHRKACIRVIESAPKTMRARLASVLLEDTLAQDINLARPGILDELKWRYDLSTYIGRQKRLLRRLLIQMLVLKLYHPEHLKWVTDLAERANKPLTYKEVNSVIQKYANQESDDLRVFAKAHLRGNELSQQLIRIDGAQKNYIKWRREEDRLNTPG